MGLAPLVVQTIFDTIRDINSQGMTVLVEQNTRPGAQPGGRGYVIETGKIVLEDEAGALLENEQVRKAYLGEEYRRAPWPGCRSGGGRGLAPFAHLPRVRAFSTRSSDPRAGRTSGPPWGPRLRAR